MNILIKLLDVNINDVDSKHRICSSKNLNRKIRPTVVKFTRYNPKREVVRSKTNWKAKISTFSKFNKS